MKLYELAKLIRSKNAGAFMLTIDIMFEDSLSYKKVKSLKTINKEIISNLYNLPEKDIKLIECDESNSIKISIPRSKSAGGLGDTDVFGGQQHGPLVNLEV